MTDEHVHDSKALPELVEDITKSDSITTIGKLIFGDVTVEGNDIFRCLVDKGILPCIKVRKNARIKLKKGHILRNLSAISQKNDLQKWKVAYHGQRWIVETIFSSIKRMFVREYVYSVKFENMIQEMMLKASLYNKLISV